MKSNKKWGCLCYGRELSNQAEIEHNLTLSGHMCKKLLSHEIIIALLFFLKENVTIDHNGKKWNSDTLYS